MAARAWATISIRSAATVEMCASSYSRAVRPDRLRRLNTQADCLGAMPCSSLEKPDVALRSNVFPTEHLYFQGVVPDMESLPAMNLGEDVGKMWAVTSINRYYVWTGNGWVTAPYRAIFEHTKEDIDLLLKPDKENSQDTGE